MYSDIKSVQLLVASLKSYNIRTVVLTSGACSIPVIHSIEVDKDFTCYSQVDERGAVYLAIGLAKSLEEPVAVVCTSGTAGCNYLPGLKYASLNGIPIVAITSDKAPKREHHLAIQKINQNEMFENNVLASTTVPIIKDQKDEQIVKSELTRVLNYLRSTRPGPVHINIYTDGDTKSYNTKKLPQIKSVERINPFVFLKEKDRLITELGKFKRILVVVGQSSTRKEELDILLSDFSKKYEVAILAEHVSNISYSGAIMGYPLTEQINTKDFIKSLKPDLVITFGGNYASYEIKSILASITSDTKYWWIDPEGKSVEVWRRVDKIFAFKPELFFKVMQSDDTNCMETNAYKAVWEKKCAEINIPESALTSLGIFQRLQPYFGEFQLIHCGILNSTRLLHLQKIERNVKVYSNLGTLGIDGSLSTFLGQASVAPEKKSLCIIGDLSFIYDIDAIIDRNLGKGVKIVILNNYGGSEFHFNTGKDCIQELDQHIALHHNTTMETYIHSLGVKYFCIRPCDDITNKIKEFIDYNDAAILECFTDIEEDAKALKDMLSSNGYVVNMHTKTQRFKEIIKKVIGVEKANKLIRITKILLE